jgi:integrase
MGNGPKTGKSTPDSDRKHLTDLEVEKLMDAAKDRRGPERDRCLVLLIYRHGLCVSEACRLRLDQVDTESRLLHITRLKCGPLDYIALTGRRAAPSPPG